MMSQTTQTPPSLDSQTEDTGPDLDWQVHLARRSPHRLPGVFLILCLGAGCIWLMFRQPLPVVAAVCLLVGACSDFLFPLRFRINAVGVYANGITRQSHLAWKEIRRMMTEPRMLTLTSLPAPSRLDAFRGVTLRFAPKGQPGDRASVLAALREYAPELFKTPETATESGAEAVPDAAQDAADRKEP